MPNLGEVLSDRVRAFGLEVNDTRLIAAPEFGGDFKGGGKAVRAGGLLGEAGEYTRNSGKNNYYGYLGYQPLELNKLRLGGAIGAYGQDLQGVNALAGLLATYPIKNGFARLLVSPGKDAPAVFLGLEKRF